MLFPDFGYYQKPKTKKHAVIKLLVYNSSYLGTFKKFHNHFYLWNTCANNKHPQV